MTYKRTIRIVITILIVLSFSTVNKINVYAATVNDVRELIGEQRKDIDKLKEDVENLARKYLTAELNNVAAVMFELGDKISENTDDEIERIELKRQIDAQSEALYKSFTSNKTADTVLSLKVSLESSMTEVSKLRDGGSDINVEFIPNRWTEEYIKAQEAVASYTDDFDIGDVGINLDSPVKGIFIINSPFGVRTDPFNSEDTGTHSGVDFMAPEGTSVRAQWNGVVTNVYTSERSGKLIEIQHGKGLKTRYAHLSEQLVKIGDTVKQYQEIGLSGNTGNSTGPHLHIEVLVDNEIVNPLLLYGSRGITAFNDWLKKYPDALVEMLDTQIIKDKTATSDGYIKGFYNPIPKKYIDENQDTSDDDVVELPDGYTRPEPGVLP